MRVLGISAFRRSAAALIVDGQVVAAAREAQFTRRTDESRFPHHAVDYCLRHDGTRVDQIDVVAFDYEPSPTFSRVWKTALAFAPARLSEVRTMVEDWRTGPGHRAQLQAGVRHHLGETFDQFEFVDPHVSLAAGAYYPSPFKRALVLTLGGMTARTPIAGALGEGDRLLVFKELRLPHSLDHLLAAFTAYLGLGPAPGGLRTLAPFGQPTFVTRIRDHLIDVKDDGSFRLNMAYFGGPVGDLPAPERLQSVFDGAPRDLTKPLTQRELDLAASAQAVVDDVIVRLAVGLRKDANADHLCLAGGATLDPGAVGRLHRESPFADIWVQPATGDVGGALGAAWVAHHASGSSRAPLSGGRDGMQGAFLGPDFTQSEIQTELIAAGARFTVFEEEDMIETTAKAIADGQTVGWFNGRMELSERSLGARAILRDPRGASTPPYDDAGWSFSPSILPEYMSEWFVHHRDSPYRMVAAPLVDARRIGATEDQETLIGTAQLTASLSQVPAVTRGDYTAELHTVHPETHPRYYRLVSRFYAKTGLPMVACTTFGTPGQPSVCTPTDAYRCFMAAGLDMLTIGQCVMWRSNQVSDDESDDGVR